MHLSLYLKNKYKLKVNLVAIHDTAKFTSRESIETFAYEKTA